MLFPELSIPEQNLTIWQRLWGWMSSLLAWTIGLGIVVGVAIALIKGMDWIALTLYPWVLTITEIALLIAFPLCLPFALARRTRGYAGYGVGLVSLIVTAYLWLYSLIMAFTLAGVVWLIIGILMAGLGVIGVAGIAALLQGKWTVVITIIINIGIIVALRMFGTFLVERSDLE